MFCSCKFLKCQLQAKLSDAYSQKDPWNFVTSVRFQGFFNFVLLKHNSDHIRRSLRETVRRSIYLPLCCHHRSGGVEIIPSACVCVLIPAGDHISIFVKPVPDSVYKFPGIGAPFRFLRRSIALAPGALFFHPAAALFRLAVSACCGISCIY